MANTVGLDKLPPELIHRILDCLDIKTIFYSLRGVCRQLNYTLGTYNQYRFNFQSISKHDFHLICRLIPHDQVVSLTLSDGNDTPGQIMLFFSHFDIKKFVRLSSLTLHEIEDIDLQQIFKKISLKSLKCLSINCRRKCGYETERLLGNFLIKHSLQKLSLDSSLCNILRHNKIVNIIHLVLNECDIRRIERILSTAISLKTLDVTNVLYDRNDYLREMNSPLESSKLNYLSISSSYLTMDMIMNFFNWLIPRSKELQRLRVISYLNDETYFDGASWESLLSATSLIEFRFRFYATLIINESISEILLPFRSRFWVNEKHWFVACDKNRFHDLSVLYSIPWCDEKLMWQPLENFESANTLPNGEYSIFNEVNDLHIKLNCPVLKSNLFPYHRFPCVSSLTIDSITTPNIYFSLGLISSLNVILSQLVTLVLSAYINQPRSRLSSIFERTPSLRNLITRKYLVLDHIKAINNREMMSRIRLLNFHEQLHQKSDILWLCEAFPNVEHLYVRISCVAHMRTLCLGLQFNLATVHFHCSSIARDTVRLEKTKVSLLNWLHEQQWKFSFHSKDELIAFWLSSRQTKGWWNRKRRHSLISNDQISKRIKNNQDN